MSTVVHQKGHRHSRSAAMPPNTASPHHPQNPHYLNLQAQAHNSEMEYSAQPTTPPRTPRRDNGRPPAQNKTNPSAPEPGSKQKPRTKRPKNVLTSPPPVARNGQNTPAIAGQSGGAPSSAKPITTPSTAAFAGPTFHASPAPSALPIPSFYSKSVPESPGMKGMKPMKEPSSPDSTTPPPARVSHLQFHREESPLDIFFRADREEKARARSASSSQTTTAVSGPFKPPSESPRATQTPPAASAQSRLRQASKVSSSGIFTMELDGSPGPSTPFGPAFSTPYSERINAARSANSPVASRDSPINGAQSTSTSEALKAYLFSGPQNSSPAPSAANPFGGSSLPANTTFTSPAGYRNPNPSHPLSPTSSFPKTNNYPGSQDLKMSSAHASKNCGRPASGLRQEVNSARTPTKTVNRTADYATSTMPSRVYGHPSNANDFNNRGSASPHPASPFGTPAGNNPGDLKDMEDNLRKMLKLDSAGSSGASGQGIERAPAATVPVPGYAGGRAPPMNGMHNGVMGS